VQNHKKETEGIDIEPLSEDVSLQKRWGMACIVEEFTVLPAHPRVYTWMEWTKPAFAFPVEAGLHLLTRVWWKAELT